ncbi:MAG: polyprenyl synthetase family protein [Candidatus Bipolaricaulota bacterium]|nr:polyprenyl synthetase family protein [Candidatus Bipolaricaulota bacterium]
MTSRILDAHRDEIRSAMAEALRGDTPLLRELRVHVGLEDEGGRAIDGMGKLLRPSLVLFVADELGAPTAEALPAAVGLELVHNFSLVHDDIQDQDRTRRGRPTVWARCGIPEAINAGDLLHAIATIVVLRAGGEAGAALAAALAGATAEMIEGQSLDLAFEKRSATVDEYVRMIDQKTGALLRCAFELGGIVAGADAKVRGRLASLGRAVGRAFQIQDDLLGVWGDGDTIGKPRGSDVRRRKKSFPVAAVFSRAAAADRARLEAIYASEPVSEPDVRWVIGTMERLGVRDEGAAKVREYLAEADAGLESLPLSSKGKNEARSLFGYLAGRER